MQFVTIVVIIFFLINENQGFEIDAQDEMQLDKIQYPGHRQEISSIKDSQLIY